MQALVQVLKKIYHDYAVLYPPADIGEIQKVLFSLHQNGNRTLPSDYRDFLMLTDGLFWNGIELCSAVAHERDKGAFTHKSIISVQASYDQNPRLIHKVVLGFAPEEIIVYDSQQKEYELLDRYTYQPFVKFPRFADALYYYVRNVIDK